MTLNKRVFSLKEENVESIFQSNRKRLFSLKTKKSNS